MAVGECEIVNGGDGNGKDDRGNGITFRERPSADGCNRIFSTLIGYFVGDNHIAGCPHIVDPCYFNGFPVT